MPTKTRLEPQPPDLQPPWRTAARVELQIEARTFAQDVETSSIPRRRRCHGVLSTRWPRRAGSALPFQPSMAVWGSGCSNNTLSRMNLPSLGFQSAAYWLTSEVAVVANFVNFR